MTIIERAQSSKQCRHLEADLDPYGEWYLYCALGETATENKCQKGNANCDLFQGLRL